MKKSLPIIVILAVLAIAGFTLYFVNKSKLSEKEGVMQNEMAQLLEDQKRFTSVESSLREDKAESDRLAREAMEARQMAEAQAASERQEREKLVAELNTRLAREATERKQAEEAQQELTSKMAALQEAQQEAQAALEQLKTTREQSSSEPQPDEAALQAKLQQQKSQLAMLEQENASLKERQAVLEQQQITTEEAIISAGGEISLPYPEIRSPNVRRRDAIYFKQRVAGHGTPEG